MTMGFGIDGRGGGTTRSGSSLPSRLGELAGFATEVGAAANRLPAQPRTATVRNQLIAKAAATVEQAKQPVTIGVVGEYSAGKSLLLGLLLGKPDLLPVSDDPTTANVTSLQLTQGSPGAPAAIIAAQVHYLAAAELEDCLREMLDELADRAASARLPVGPVVALRESVGSDALWPALEQWCRDQAWPTQDARLLNLVRELLRLGDAALAAPAYLGWREATIEPGEIERALRLPQPAVDPSAFPERELAHAGLGARPPKLTAVPLSQTLPLVERVTLDVSVPPTVWDLTHLRGENQLVLLDFPGLNSTVSGVRDRYLSRRELADVTTIFILLNAIASGSAAATEFPSMLQRSPAERRESVQVGIGRFDQLPNRIPDVRDPEVAITDQALADGMLRTVLSNARSLVGADHDERIAFHSGMVGIAALDDREPNTPHYGAEFSTERQLVDHVPRACAAAAAWGEVAARLTVDDPVSELRPALAAFAADGGVRLIRERLERHVIEHGMALRVAQVERMADELDALRQQLVEEVRRDRSGEERARQAARQPVDDLLDDVRQQLTGLITRAQLELGDPYAVQLADGLNLLEAVRARAVEEVFSWPEWGSLFRAVSERSITVRERASKSMFFDDEDDDEDAPADTLPAETDVFAIRFEESAAASTTFAVEQAWESLADWLRRADVGLAPSRARRAALVDGAAEARVSESAKARGFARVLARTQDLGWLPDAVRAAVAAEPANEELDGPSRTAAAFPLRRGVGFAWSPDAPRVVGDTAVAQLARHQVRPARLRRELVNGVVEVVLARLGALQRQIAGNTTKAFDEALVRLERSEAYVNAVVGVVTGPRDDPAAELAEIRRPRPPVRT